MQASLRAWLGALALLGVLPRTASAQPAEAPSPFPGLAAALRAARPGDTIRLPPGEFFECGVVLQDGLVIEGAGAGATVLTDRVCEGKALLVIRGRGVVVRDLTLARARTPEENGAGIRAEGEDLLLERVLFDNNQIGVLAGAGFRGRLDIRGSRFLRHGLADSPRPSAAILVGAADMLRIEETEVAEGRGGAAVVSAAGLTDLRGGAFLRAAAPQGATVQVSGGLRLEGARLQAGPMPSGGRAAVLALPASQASTLLLRGNRLEGEGVLLLDWSGAGAELAGNRLDPGAAEISRSGAWRHWLGAAARRGYAELRHLAGEARRDFLALIRS